MLIKCSPCSLQFLDLLRQVQCISAYMPLPIRRRAINLVLLVLPIYPKIDIKGLQKAICMYPNTPTNTN